MHRFVDYALICLSLLTVHLPTYTRVGVDWYIFEWKLYVSSWALGPWLEPLAQCLWLVLWPTRLNFWQVGPCSISGDPFQPTQGNDIWLTSPPLHTENISQKECSALLVHTTVSTNLFIPWEKLYPRSFRSRKPRKWRLKFLKRVAKEANALPDALELILSYLD